MGLAAEIAASLALGAATPLSAVCVLPLYPGFLAFLSRQGDTGRSITVLAGLVAAGVITFVGAIGLLFTTVLGTSLTAVVEAVSPPAFAVLGLLGVALIAGRHPFSRLPTVGPPETRSPSLSAFAYGAFFGAIVLPCNPGFVSAFFARALLFADPVASLANFGAFGVGMASPLVVLAVVSEPWRNRVLGALTTHERAVEVITGVVLVAVSLYYLFVVFAVVGPVG